METIRSERLELVSLSVADIEDLLEGRSPFNVPAGWPDEHDAPFLRFRADQMGRDPESQEWLVRLIVLDEPGRPVIGHAGFHGSPGVNAKKDPRAVELGYTVFEPNRGHGYATEAAKALIEWARGTHGIALFIASVAPDNAPSLAIVRKLGFVETGEHWDEEDGLELEFELERL